MKTSLYQVSFRTLLAFLLFLQTSGIAQVAPEWWTSRGVVNPVVTAADLNATTLHQLRIVAQAAQAEVAARFGVPDPAIDAMVVSLVNDDVARSTFDPVTGKIIHSPVITIGELKTAVLPYYEFFENRDYRGPPIRIDPKNMDWRNPWTEDMADDRDGDLASNGQLKYVFSFAIPDCSLVPDPFGDIDGDDLTNLDECLCGLFATPTDLDGDGREDTSDPSVSPVLIYQDYNGDGIPTPGDFDEDNIFDRFDRDVDGDGAPDGWEKAYGFNPMDPRDCKVVVLDPNPDNPGTTTGDATSGTTGDSSSGDASSDDGGSSTSGDTQGGSGTADGTSGDTTGGVSTSGDTQGGSGTADGTGGDTQGGSGTSGDPGDGTGGSGTTGQTAGDSGGDDGGEPPDPDECILFDVLGGAPFVTHSSAGDAYVRVVGADCPGGVWPPVVIFEKQDGTVEQIVPELCYFNASHPGRCVYHILIPDLTCKIRIEDPTCIEHLCVAYDCDGDGLFNIEEYFAGTDPCTKDNTVGIEYNDWELDGNWDGDDDGRLTLDDLNFMLDACNRPAAEFSAFTSTRVATSMQTGRMSSDLSAGSSKASNTGPVVKRLRAFFVPPADGLYDFRLETIELGVEAEFRLNSRNTPESVYPALTDVHLFSNTHCGTPHDSDVEAVNLIAGQRYYVELRVLVPAGATPGLERAEVSWRRNPLAPPSPDVPVNYEVMRGASDEFRIFPDVDNDGLTDYVDLDGDGTPDSGAPGTPAGGSEFIRGTRIVDEDTDLDGTIDAFGIDSDGDGMPDGWEVAYGLNPLDASDAVENPDGDVALDGVTPLTNLDECRKGTNPRVRLDLATGLLAHYTFDVEIPPPNQRFENVVSPGTFDILGPNDDVQFGPGVEWAQSAREIPGDPRTLGRIADRFGAPNRAMDFRQYSHISIGLADASGAISNAFNSPNFTVSMWINPRAFTHGGPAGGLNANVSLFSYYGAISGVTGRGRGYEMTALQACAPAREYRNIRTQTAEDLPLTSIIESPVHNSHPVLSPRGEWAMVSMVYQSNADGTFQVTGYHNGRSLGTNITNMDYEDHPGSFFTLGNAAVTGRASADYIGGMDDVIFYQRALTADEIRCLFVQQSRNPALGFLLRERWFGLSGSLLISDLTSDGNYPTNPSNTDFIDESNYHDGLVTLGTRLRGFIMPDVTGDYEFGIQADDEGAFWIADDQNPIDSLMEPSLISEASNTSIDVSVPKRLEAGRWYYIEVLHKHNTGPNQLAVTWRPAGGTAWEDLSVGATLRAFVIGGPLP